MSQFARSGRKPYDFEIFEQLCSLFVLHIEQRFVWQTIVKNQYFGDIQDYRKYGLLRQLTGYGQMRLGVIWMLTPSDTRADGRKTEYLNQPERYRNFDAELFDALRSCVLEDQQRDVSQAASRGFLPNTLFFSSVISDRLEERKNTMQVAQQVTVDADLVFFDPDNGFEVASCAKGKGNSSKYVFWDEIYQTYQNGHSVLTYQHFPRMAREEYVQKRLEELKSRLPDAIVIAFCTPHVGFFLAVQPAHVLSIEARLPGLVESWGNEFSCTHLIV